ncbi:TetR/AcrR family transcriptional regulator [Nocardia sp. NPDC058499]|uniref:TetR/AcrR family transcriptional regulator n=1 Tax=Nocardia sp. NPDC058499 TaxID=3346530 RepID=UPI0036629CFF
MAEDQRARILDASAQLLARQPNARMDDIAKSAGVSRATLHRYFPGRETLLVVLEQVAAEKMQAAVAMADLASGPAPVAVIRLIEECESVAPYLALLYQQGGEVSADGSYSRWAEIDTDLTTFFRRGQQQGEFVLTLTPAWLTDAFFSLVTSASWSISEGRVAARDFVHCVGAVLLPALTTERSEIIA